MNKILMYNGQEVKEVRNASGGGYNLMTAELIERTRISAKQALTAKQTIILKDGTEVVGTIGDISITEK